MEKTNYTKEQKKTILIYCGELAIFSVVFFTIGLLILLEVIGIKDWKRYVFTYLTLIGGIWPIADFIWMLASPKHRSHNSMVDKCLLLPVPLALIPFDIWVLTQGINNVEDVVFRFGISIPLMYISIVYLFECVYHYFKPIPMLLEEDEEEKEKENRGEINLLFFINRYLIQPDNDPSQEFPYGFYCLSPYP